MSVFRWYFSISECTDITKEYMATVHHEMGHVEYFLQYKEQPVVYRGGANPGTHSILLTTIPLTPQVERG